VPVVRTGHCSRGIIQGMILVGRMMALRGRAVVGEELDEGLRMEDAVNGDDCRCWESKLER
jgi:hypothetical protein